MNKKLFLRFYSWFLAILFIAGCSTPKTGMTPPKDNTVFYQNLSGVTGWKENVNVKKVLVTSNEDQIKAEFAVIPLSSLKIFSTPSPTMQSSDLVPINDIDLKDTIALVCTMTNQKGGYLATPHIKGVSHVHKRVSEQIDKDELYPIVSGDSTDKLFMYKGSTPGPFTVSPRLVGYVSDPGSKKVVVLFLPNIPRSYDVSFSTGQEPMSPKMTISLEP
jgi:hypothetical protein